MKVCCKDGKLSESKLKHASLSTLHSVAASLGLGKKELIAFISQKMTLQRGGTEDISYDNDTKTISITPSVAELTNPVVQAFFHIYKTAFTAPTTFESDEWRNEMTAEQRLELYSTYPTVLYKNFRFKVHVARPYIHTFNRFNNPIKYMNDTVNDLYSGIQNLHIYGENIYLFKAVKEDEEMLTSIRTNGLRPNSSKMSGAIGQVDDQDTSQLQRTDSGKQYFSGTHDGAKRYLNETFGTIGGRMLMVMCPLTIASTWNLVINTGTHMYVSVDIPPEYIYVFDKGYEKKVAIFDQDVPRNDNNSRKFAGKISIDGKQIEISEYGYTTTASFNNIRDIAPANGGAVTRRARRRR